MYGQGYGRFKMRERPSLWILLQTSSKADEKGKRFIYLIINYMVNTLVVIAMLLNVLAMVLLMMSQKK